MTNKKYFISKMWASDVKKRDLKQCVVCGSKKELEAHHIFGISQYPYLTTEINNGVTLCKKCHNKYHQQYEDINAITWTQFILNNKNNITNLEISYANGYTEKIPITTKQNIIKQEKIDNLTSKVLNT